MKAMNIILTGGGSGGHITPVLAVAHELKVQSPDCRVTYIGQKGDDLLDIVQANASVDAVSTIYAGKLRRYSGEGWRQLLDIKTQFLNIRDVFLTIYGVGQSYFLLGRIRPAVVFTRGGFVSVPVAVAARLRGIPYITHDADTVPSLANRLIARWAAIHAVALPVEVYPYPKEKTVQVGIPAGAAYAPVSEASQAQFRHELELDDYQQIVLVTGGGNGARMLNECAVANTRYLLSIYPDLAIIHFAGRSLEAETAAAYDALDLGKARSRVRVYGFAADFYRYSGAADLIVARGGMGSLTEFALQQKACVIVPSKQLSWNVKNSRVLAQRGAVVELTEDQAEQPERLGRTIRDLLDHPEKRIELGRKLATLARPTAAHDLAAIVLQCGERG